MLNDIDKEKLLNRPWPDIDTHIRKKYNIVAEIDLVELDSNPGLLYKTLQTAYKKSYGINDRILIYHYDTDYYYNNGSPGFTINNLITCLNSLDISTNFCLFLTNHYGIAQEINNLSINQINMSIFESNYTGLQTTPTPIYFDINIDQIEKTYCCLNGVQRLHRVLFLSYLKKYQLLDKGILSWHFNVLTSHKSKSKGSTAEKSDPTIPVFVITTPFSRVNNSFSLDSMSKYVFNKYSQTFSTNWKDPSIVGTSNQNRWNIPAVQQGFLYVSIETVMQYPYPFLTEKTYRAILHKRPFVIVGAPGSVAQLKKLGFKTFEKLWDESYDSINDPNQRIRAIVEIINKFGELSNDQLQDIMYSIKDIVEFNYEFYVNEFANTILKNRLATL
jgi:hypothetical protein